MGREASAPGNALASKVPATTTPETLGPLERAVEEHKLLSRLSGEASRVGETAKASGEGSRSRFFLFTASSHVPVMRLLVNNLDFRVLFNFGIRNVETFVDSLVRSGVPADYTRCVSVGI